MSKKPPSDEEDAFKATNKSVISPPEPNAAPVLSADAPNIRASQPGNLFFACNDEGKAKNAEAKGQKKSKKRSADKKSKSTDKRSKSGSKQTQTQKKSSSKKKNKAKKKSSDGKGGAKSRSKEKEGHRRERRHQKIINSLPTMTEAEKAQMEKNVRAVQSTAGAIAVTSERQIIDAGYLIVGSATKLFQSDTSQVLKVKKNGASGLVVKVVNLTECTARFRTNLLANSMRILRYVSGISEEQKAPICSVFISVYDIFVVGGAKLYVFMAECPPYGQASSMYDLVKGDKPLPALLIRDWFKGVVNGVDALQRLGVAHRAIKLPHILFDAANQTKLCGWGRAVFIYDPKKKSLQLQRKERRVRRNSHLPPEALLGSYEASRADIWSAGVALVAMCTKRYPFNVRDKKTKFTAQWRQFVKKNELNPTVRALCHKMFAIEPKSRISSAAILAHPYFTLDDKKLEQVNCKAKLSDITDDNKVGAVSTFDYGPVASETKVAEPEVEEEVNWTEEANADKSGTEDTATGEEGGNVGEEENLPKAEAEDESQAAEKNAPEEGETEAQPEDGDNEETAAEEAAEEAEE